MSKRLANKTIEILVREKGIIEINFTKRTPERMPKEASLLRIPLINKLVCFWNCISPLESFASSGRCGVWVEAEPEQLFRLVAKHFAAQASAVPPNSKSGSETRLARRSLRHLVSVKGKKSQPAMNQVVCRLVNLWQLSVDCCRYRVVRNASDPGWCRLKTNLWTGNWFGFLNIKN